MQKNTFKKTGNRLAAALGLGALALLGSQVFSQEQDALDYDAGVRLITDQQWSAAQDYFTEFQSNYPQSAWADDAAFWNCYAIEQAGTEQDQHFDCYQGFIDGWPDSSWVADARSKLAVLGSRLADLGYPNYLEQAFDDFDFDFDFDFDEEEISQSVERAMARAERDMQRAERDFQRIRVFNDVQVPSVNINSIGRDIRVAVEDRIATRTSSSRRNTRNSADDELLSIVSALRENARASDILIQRLEASDNADLRRRIVILLEDFPGQHVNTALTNVINNDESEEVRNSAILVLLDREDESSQPLLREIATNPEYPISIRAEILGEMEDWDPQLAITTLSAILVSETDPNLIAEAADALSDMETPESLTALIGAYDAVENLAIQHEILEEIADVETPEVLTFLTNVALSDVDDETAAVAIDGIADREGNFGVTALRSIYVQSSSLQRRLAILDGIGETENEFSVEVLQQLLVDEENNQIIAGIVRALGDTERESAVAPVIDSYRSSSDETVRRAALRALRRLDQYPQATEAMLEILEMELDERAGL